MTCPFKVGDRVHEVVVPVSATSMVFNGIWQLMDPASFRLDSAKPDATVLALTARGFTYRYDWPLRWTRPVWATIWEGEVYEEGFHMWRKVDPQP